jgi:formyl-CoA transferase
MQRIDEAISQWTSQRTLEEALKEMERAEVPAGRIYSAADIAADPHFAARGMIQEVIAGDGEPLKVPGVVPKLSATPGAIRSAAPKLGEHTEAVLTQIGYGAAEIEELRKKRIV